MKKAYAIIHYAYVGDSENPLVCIDMAIIAYHKWMYEKICGYSLGHEAQFYDTLEDAKPNAYGYCAIVEFDTNNKGEITKLCNLHEYNGVKTQTNVDHKTGVITRVEKQDWVVTPLVVGGNCSNGAQDELARQFAKHSHERRILSESAASLNQAGLFRSPANHRGRSASTNDLHSTPKPH